MEEFNEIISSIYGNVDKQALEFGIKFASSILILIASVIGIIIIISMWKIFKKAGEKPWKSLIPIYNYITLYKVSGISPLFLLTLIFFIIPQTRLVCFIIWNIVDATQKAMLARKFNKSIWFIVGMILFDFIFYPILAFGKSELKKESID